MKSVIEMLAGTTQPERQKLLTVTYIRDILKGLNITSKDTVSYVPLELASHIHRVAKELARLTLEG